MGLARYLPSASAVSKTLVLATILRRFTIGPERASPTESAEGHPNELAESQMYILLGVAAIAAFYHVAMHPYKNIETAMMDAIGTLSPAQHQWFMGRVKELKSQQLNPVTYGERLVELLGEATSQ